PIEIGTPRNGPAVHFGHPVQVSLRHSVRGVAAGVRDNRLPRALPRIDLLQIALVDDHPYHSAQAADPLHFCGEQLALVRLSAVGDLHESDMTSDDGVMMSFADVERVCL